MKEQEQPKENTTEQFNTIPDDDTFPDKFNIAGYYDPVTFLGILRACWKSLNNDAAALMTIIPVLEHWEKRVIDIIAEIGSEEVKKLKIYFVTGEDGVTRIAFNLELEED